MNATIHPHAEAAIRAARNFSIWGRYAAMRYCQRRGVHPALLRLARQLHATRHAWNE